MGQVRGTSLPPGASGTRRDGDRVRNRQGGLRLSEVPPEDDDRGDRPEKLPLDRVRRRLRVPGGVQGHGGAHPGREAVRREGRRAGAGVAAQAGAVRSTPWAGAPGSTKRTRRSPSSRTSLRAVARRGSKGSTTRV